MELAEQETRHASEVPTSSLRLGSRNRQILLKADEFATKYELDDIRDQIRIGALILDDPDQIESLEGLTDEDIRILKTERAPLPSPSLGEKWWLKYPYFCTLGGALLGLVDMLLSRLPMSLQSSSHSYQLGYVVGACCVIPLFRYLGRRDIAIKAAALKLVAIVAVTIIGPSFSSITSVTLGISSGLLDCVIPIYLAEISPKTIRAGILLTFPLIRNTTLWFFNKWSELPVPAVYSLAIFFMMILIAVFWFAAESPYWSVHQGEMRQAFKALRRHRPSNIQASRDLYQIYAFGASKSQVTENRYISIHTAVQTLAICLIVTSSNTIIGVLLSLQEMWVDTFAQKEKDFQNILPLTLTRILCVSIAITAIQISSIDFLERYGRRAVLLTCMIAISVIIPVTNWIRNLAGIWGLIQRSLFPLFLMVPSGPAFYIPQIFVAEVSCEGRDYIMTIIQVASLYKNNAIAKYVLKALDPLDYRFYDNFYYRAPLALFAGIHILLTILVFLTLMETRGLALEEISQALAVPIWRRTFNRVRNFLPWIRNRVSGIHHGDLESSEESDYVDGAVRLE